MRRALSALNVLLGYDSAAFDDLSGTADAGAMPKLELENGAFFKPTRCATFGSSAAHPV